ncbi:hypothetical protein SAMN06265365_101557 [Tistlia consotensis]|uniref:DUF1150 family protein n=1 Tax=Tistlia consotensis USBA 355 TaxID=560819 RepID=A0A1Y6BAD3_9PROT|nr:DUF1150 family protein [Tistlia consotensis]SME93121.1 hypothetical protein SAMN05428998_101556 [Tistlia consotensis USBA 355]SNR28430.1 hypothetical protein SAMN06265365_101557 [Tistlia consotensis]
MNQHRSQDFEPLSQQDFLAFGLNDVAYLRDVETEDGVVVGIFAADGTRMAVMKDLSTAAAAVRQNEMEPLSVH